MKKRTKTALVVISLLSFDYLLLFYLLKQII